MIKKPRRWRNLIATAMVLVLLETDWGDCASTTIVGDIVPIVEMRYQETSRG